MNALLFSDAMSELSEKYIIEAATFTAKKKSAVHVWLYRAACLFLTVFLMGSVVLTFSVEARAIIFGWVRQQYESFYEYFFEGEPEVTEPLQYYPGWLPEGCEFVNSIETDGGEILIYTDEQDTLIRFSYTHGSAQESLSVDGVDYVKETVEIKGAKGEVYISPNENETNSLFWTDEDEAVLFTVSGNFDKNTIIRIAENVQVKEVQKDYCLGWLPDDCEFVYSGKTVGGYDYIFNGPNDLLVQFGYISDPEHEKLYANSVGSLEKSVTINGNRGTLYISQEEEVTSSLVWTDETTNTLFHVSGPYDEDTLIKMAENIRLKGTNELYSLGWIPEGFSFETSYELPDGEVHVYVGANYDMLQFTYSHAMDGSSLFVDKEGYEVKTVVIGNYTGDLYLTTDEDKVNGIVWSNEDDVLFFISAPLDADGLIKLAERVYVIN